MRHRLRDLAGRAKNRVRPHALSLLGSLPATPWLSGLGHILMFHRVVPPTEISPYGMAAFEMTPRQLELVIEFFHALDYRIISLDDMRDALVRGDIDHKFVVLTFDDGYRDTLEAAYPILAKHAAPFTVYVTTNYIDRTAVKWDYLAEEVVHENQSVTIRTRSGAVDLDCSTADSKRRSCDILQSHLFDMNRPETFDDMRSFFESCGRDVHATTDALMLDWRQLQELAADPLVTIGCHTANHFVLSRLPPEFARQEIEVSKARLEERLGIDVHHFSYPYGRGHEAGAREYDLVARSGFSTGTTGVKGNILRNHADRLTSLPRFCIGSTCTAAHLSAIANGSLPFIANRFKRIA